MKKNTKECWCAQLAMAQQTSLNDKVCHDTRQVFRPKHTVPWSIFALLCAGVGRRVWPLFRESCHSAVKNGGCRVPAFWQRNSHFQQGLGGWSDLADTQPIETDFWMCQIFWHSNGERAKLCFVRHRTPIHVGTHNLAKCSTFCPHNTSKSTVITCRGRDESQYSPKQKSEGKLRPTFHFVLSSMDSSSPVEKKNQRFVEKVKQNLRSKMLTIPIHFFCLFRIVLTANFFVSRSSCKGQWMAWHKTTQKKVSSTTYVFLLNHVLLRQHQKFSRRSNLSFALANRGAASQPAAFRHAANALPIWLGSPGLIILWSPCSWVPCVNFVLTGGGWRWKGHRIQCSNSNFRGIKAQKSTCAF